MQFCFGASRCTLDMSKMPTDKRDVCEGAENKFHHMHRKNGQTPQEDWVKECSKNHACAICVTEEHLYATKSVGLPRPGF